MELNFVREQSVPLPLRSNASSAKKTTGWERWWWWRCRGKAEGWKTMLLRHVGVQQLLADVSCASRLPHQLSSKHPENASSLAGCNNWRDSRGWGREDEAKLRRGKLRATLGLRDEDDDAPAATCVRGNTATFLVNYCEWIPATLLHCSAHRLKLYEKYTGSLALTVRRTIQSLVFVLQYRAGKLHIIDESSPNNWSWKMQRFWVKFNLKIKYLKMT